MFTVELSGPKLIPKTTEDQVRCGLAKRDAVFPGVCLHRELSILVQCQCGTHNNMMPSISDPADELSLWAAARDTPVRCENCNS